MLLLVSVLSESCNSIKISNYHTLKWFCRPNFKNDCWRDFVEKETDLPSRNIASLTVAVINDEMSSLARGLNRVKMRIVFCI